MNDRILEHIELCVKVKKLQLPYEIFGDCTEKTLQNFCLCAERLDFGNSFVKMKLEMVKSLTGDIDFLSVVNKSLQLGITLDRIESMVIGAEKEPLSKFDTAEIQEVMQDLEIDGRHQFRYLKFFYKYNMTSEEKEYLMDGLDFLDNNTETALEQLTESEQKLLMEPVFGTRLLKAIGETKGFWQMLLDKALLVLVNYLSKQCYSLYSLNETQFLQLVEKPAAILALLNEILSVIEENRKSSFLDIWLKNEALYYDLEKLAKVIGSLTEKELIQITQKRAAYIGVVYGLELKGLNMEELDDAKERIVIFAITNRKKRFLALLREQFSLFCSIPKFSLLFQTEFYQKYVNINTLNVKNLKECRELSIIPKKHRTFMIWKEYTFDEVKLLSQQPEEYTILYHQLQYNKSDDRLRILRELIKRSCLNSDMQEENIEKLARRLSQKSLTNWMQKELSHIVDLRAQTAIQLLIHWEKLERFLYEINREIQAEFLLKNMEQLEQYQNFEEIRAQIEEIDLAWKNLSQTFGFSDSLIQENRDRVEAFLFAGGAEIMHTFYTKKPEKKEEVRRLIIAEILGKFDEIKYNKDDLRREIAYPIHADCEQEWKKNDKRTGHGMEIWEEERLIPVMQIGEIPERTCLSYKSGMYKECLLSCFDANKKILFLAMGNKIVFRAIVRLTKGSFSRTRNEDTGLEFIDMLKEEKKADTPETNEILTIFLERPYMKGLPGSLIESAISMVISMVERKAKRLNAQLVLSNAYSDYKYTKENYIWASYYMYISKSKNGHQYLDSLGGESTVSNSGSYRRGKFLVYNIFE